MKHPASREFFGYWDDRRGSAAAPERSDLAPEGVRHLLGDIFVLGCNAAQDYPFRVAGTRVCALVGHDVKGIGFTALFRGTSRATVADLVAVVATETMPTVAGVAASGANGRAVPLELLLLPFSARWHGPLSLTGLLVPLDTAVPMQPPLRDFTLTSWRHIAPQPKPGPRPLRAWSVMRGLTVYEGLR